MRLLNLPVVRVVPVLICAIGVSVAQQQRFMSYASAQPVLSAMAQALPRALKELPSPEIEQRW